MNDDERLAYVIDLVRHRCPELGPADLALLVPPDDPEEMLPASILQQVVEILDRMTARQDQIESRFAAAQPEPVTLPPRLH